MDQDDVLGAYRNYSEYRKWINDYLRHGNPIPHKLSIYDVLALISKIKKQFKEAFITMGLLNLNPIRPNTVQRYRWVVDRQNGQRQIVRNNVLTPSRPPLPPRPPIPTTSTPINPGPSNPGPPVPPPSPYERGLESIIPPPSGFSDQTGTPPPPPPPINQGFPHPPPPPISLDEINEFNEVADREGLPQIDPEDLDDESFIKLRNRDVPKIKGEDLIKGKKKLKKTRQRTKSESSDGSSASGFNLSLLERRKRLRDEEEDEEDEDDEGWDMGGEGLNQFIPLPIFKNKWVKTY